MQKLTTLEAVVAGILQQLSMMKKGPAQTLLAVSIQHHLITI